VGADRAFSRWRDWTLQVRCRRRTIFLVGNGASASMASHMAADLAKNARLRTEVFSDFSLLTAVSNDMGFENVFSEPLSRRASRGDMLVAISSSGRSQNVLQAVAVARRLGLTIVTLSAMDQDNPLRPTADLSFHAPAGTYGNAESAHAAILHHWMDLVADRSGGK
jgi:D-sedoheptulose 7-phosphate isomerase